MLPAPGGKLDAVGVAAAACAALPPPPPLSTSTPCAPPVAAARRPPPQDAEFTLAGIVTVAPTLLSQMLLSCTLPALADARLASAQRSVNAAPPSSIAEGGTAANRSVTGSSAARKAEGEGVFERVVSRVAVFERERVEVAESVAAALPTGEPVVGGRALREGKAVLLGLREASEDAVAQAVAEPLRFGVTEVLGLPLCEVLTEPQREARGEAVPLAVRQAEGLTLGLREEEMDAEVQAEAHAVKTMLRVGVKEAQELPLCEGLAVPQREVEGEDEELTLVPMIEAALSALCMAPAEQETAALALSDTEGRALLETEEEREPPLEGAPLPEADGERVPTLESLALPEAEGERVPPLEGFALPEAEGEREAALGVDDGRCVIAGGALGEGGAESVASLLARSALSFAVTEELPVEDPVPPCANVKVAKTDGVPIADAADVTETLAEWEALLEGVALSVEEVVVVGLLEGVSEAEGVEDRELPSDGDCEPVPVPLDV